MRNSLFWIVIHTDNKEVIVFFHINLDILFEN